MADLTGTTPANTYKGLLQVNDYTDGISGNTSSNALAIQDGAGNNTALAISTDRVGIGTTNPNAPLEIKGSRPSIRLTDNDPAGQSDFEIVNNGSAFAIYDNANIGLGNILSMQGGVSATAGNVNISGRNLGIGTNTFGASAHRVLGIQNGTAPTSSPADMVQLYAEDVSTSELRVRDEAGNVTTLSPHAKDAPDSLYDKGKGVDEMHRVANHYLGTIIFTNVDRRNDLLQKQLNGDDLPEDRTFTVTETFAEYNARTGADLQVEDWDANQQTMADADESYVKKPKPEWLS
jgi:hypothetical protein